MISASQLRDERALAVAATLEKATNDRREADNSRWLRTQRFFGVFAALAALATIGSFLVVVFRK